MGCRDQFGTDTYVHVCNRGAKKLPIYREEGDLWRLLANFFYLNHQESMPENWVRKLKQLGLWTPGVYSWPEEWVPRAPLVAILAFCIMPNHLHLVLKEKVEKGIPKFMHRVSMSYSKFINEKYTETGSLFQGAYRSCVVTDDAYLRHLAVYVQVKNPFELNPKGLRYAIENFDTSFEEAKTYPFTSVNAYATGKDNPILDKDIYAEMFAQPETFIQLARDTMQYKLDTLDVCAL